MKLCFISNFLNHHQLPICNAFYNLLHEEFYFIASEKIPEERLKLGYQDTFDVPYFIDGTKEDVYSILQECDVYILGDAPRDYIEYGYAHNKLIFFYRERMHKDGTWHKYSPLAQYNMRTIYAKKKTANSYLLCASAYTASDFVDYGCFKDKAFKWGYFPALSDKSLDELLANKEKNTIIWAGRFLDWKQPIQVIEAAKKLKQDNLPFHITMIGNGPEEEKIKAKISEYQLNDYITLTGSLPFQEVRTYMEKAEIALFTSNFMEGWGAVLNEYMSSASATIANYKAGSTIYLIDNENGIIYDDSVEMLYTYLKQLLTNDTLR
ncbi:MAG: glycosyltransferase, partial [Erysipelotrichaceae bacterium]|nr:glycosyltransferase [Erysipelotrichaceae bacterium]